jgi:hypothetical protein
MLEKRSEIQEGIEIHFDKNRGVLELACEPDAFTPFLELVRSQLSDFPEITQAKIVEIYISDTTTIVARREEPQSIIPGFVGISLFLTVASLFGYGLLTLIRQLFFS